MTHVVGKPAPSSQRLKQLGQYASSPGHRGYCYRTQNSSFCSLAMVVAIASTHCAYPRRDGQAELAWVAGYKLATAAADLKILYNAVTNSVVLRLLDYNCRDGCNNISLIFMNIISGQLKGQLKGLDCGSFFKPA